MVNERWLRPDGVILVMMLVMFLTGTCVKAQMAVKNDGGSSGLTLDGKPYPAVLFPATPSPGSFLFDGKLYLVTDRNRISRLQSVHAFPESFELNFQLQMDKAWTLDANYSLKFNVQSGGSTCYVFTLRHDPKGNRIQLYAKYKGKPTRELLDKPYDWQVDKPVNVKLSVDQGRIDIQLDDLPFAKVMDENPIPAGKMILSVYSSRAWIDTLKVMDIDGKVLLENNFEGSENLDWTNWKQRVRIRSAQPTSFSTFDGHLYHDTKLKGTGGGFLLHDEKFWPAPGKYNWGIVDSALKDMGRRDSKARLLVRIRLEPPKWWLESHPDDRMIRVVPKTGKRENGRYASFTSRAWLNDASDALISYLKHLKKSPDGHRVAGIIIGAGGSMEWVHSWHKGFHDYSPVQLRAFRDWLKSQYQNSEVNLRQAWGDDKITFETAQVPDYLRRANADLGVFFDPAMSRQVPDYREFHSQTVADAIVHFGKVIKHQSPEMFTAVYYGYMSDDDKGHTALDRVLANDTIDCLMCPSHYVTRAPGGANSVSVPIESVKLHGKFFLLDDDTRTHLSGGTKDVLTRYYGRTNSVWETVNILRRNFAFALSKSVGLVHLDFNLGWLDDPDAMQAIAQHKRIAEMALKKVRRSNAQIAVIRSPQTPHYMLAEFRKTLINNLYNEHIPRIGSPVDVIDMNDLEIARDYKLYIFLDAFYVSVEQRRMIDRKVKRNGNTALWFYAPGCLDEHGFDDKKMQQLTGINLASHPVQSQTRLVLSDLDHPITKGIMPGLMMETLNMGGPTIYCRDENARILGYENSLVHYYQPAWRKRPETMPGFVVKEMGDWRSVWASVPNLPPAILRNIASQAGVHIYGDGDDVIYANQSMLSLHARYAGKRTIKLPQPSRVVNALTNEVISEKTTSFDISLRQFETCIWWIE